MKIEFSWSSPLLYPEDLEQWLAHETVGLRGREDQGRGL